MKTLSKKMGTPKSLEEAIENGLAHAIDAGLSINGNVAVVEVHVRDYLAQVLCAAMMQAQTDDEVELVKNISDRLGIKGGRK